MRGALPSLSIGMSLPGNASVLADRLALPPLDLAGVDAALHGRRGYLDDLHDHKDDQRADGDERDDAGQAGPEAPQQRRIGVTRGLTVVVELRHVHPGGRVQSEPPHQKRSDDGGDEDREILEVVAVEKTHVSPSVEAPQGR